MSRSTMVGRREERGSGLGALALLIVVITGCDQGFPQSEWEDPTYDHVALSGGFQLLGTHAGAPCTWCHAPGNYAPLFQATDGSDCQSCHQADYPARHDAMGYPLVCTLCHAPTVWAAGSFDHTASSGGFGLEGVHNSVPCAGCHEVETFEPIFNPDGSFDCVECHGAVFPTWHAGNGFPHRCENCHTPTAWTDGAFDHLVQSGTFALLGIHQDLPCTFCHTPGSMTPLYAPESAEDCVVCHQPVYEAVHGGTGYPVTCYDCHTPTTWKDGEFDHPAISEGFELLGAHESLACTACHDPETFEPVGDPADANDCLACHQADYDRQHGGTGYPTECTLCHTSTSWTRGGLDHVAISGGFELLGIHEALPCAACHDPVTLQPLFTPAAATDCVSCHQADYDVQHGGDGYPTDCALCHTPAVWSDADFHHDADYFPIFAGEHASRWSTCATCHADPDNFADFTCFTCHAHRQTAMDTRHSGETGYVYASSACLACHPDGES